MVRPLNMTTLDYTGLYPHFTLLFDARAKHYAPDGFSNSCVVPCRQNSSACLQKASAYVLPHPATAPSQVQ